ncbi:MAG: DUF4870 domain-containing protein [Methylacidiphilales bacterium]|nr:DUF4870 domain-containing protein [Candidatus Methylacidiphilales bacterium]
MTSNPQEKQLGMLCHLLALAGYIIPFGNIIGPLIIWQVKKGESSFVDDQGKESVNFQITVTLAAIVAVILCFLLIGFVLLPVIGIADLIFIIIAALKANEGVAYRYPYTLRLIK